MSKKTKIVVICVSIVLIALISLILFTVINNKFSRDSVINLVKKSNIPNSIYIENSIYENDTYAGVAKFYVKDNMEYIYQENKNQEKIEIFVNNEDNTSVIVLHSEKIITQTRNNDNDFNSALQPLKDTLLNELNDSLKYQYKYCGKELVNEINCIKVSLTNNENNENYNYYIDETTGYILKYENEISKNKEIYEYNPNSVTNEQIKMFNLDDYSEYTFVDSI